MKLRNKKTGEIKEVIVGGYPVSGRTEMWDCSVMNDNEVTGYESLGIYTSLAELNEDWEDYEEPEEFWYINECGDVLNYKYDGGCSCPILEAKEIGNHFDTKEEAEKAVEKLRAFKRLKDNGFRFNCWYGGSKDIAFSIPQEIIDSTTAKDLDLLFGGEE